MPWQKGQSGNPEGRKVEKLIGDQLRIILNEDRKDKETGKSVKKLRLLAEKLVDQAIEGGASQQAMILDRIDGKVPQPVSGDDDSPIRHIFEILDRRALEDQGKQLENGHDKANGHDREAQ